MKRTFNPKKFVVAGLAALALAVTPAALANFTEASNDTFYASASRTCPACADAEHAYAGDTIVASGSVANKTRSVQKTTLTVTLSGPAGVVFSASSPIVLGPGKTVSKSAAAVVSDAYPAGVYTLTVGIDGINTSASIAVGDVATG